MINKIIQSVIILALKISGKKCKECDGSGNVRVAIAKLGSTIVYDQIECPECNGYGKVFK